jgi:GNAT superfamily N-acetyltransferase
MAIRGPRAAKPTEVGAVLKLANDIFRPKAPVMGRAFPTLFRPENARYLRIFADGSRPVSLVGACVYEMAVFGCRLRTGNVGAVCTHPDYRGRGFASRLLDDMIALLRRDGVHVMDVSGGRGMYQRAGCVRTGGLLVYPPITAEQAARLVSPAAASPVDYSARYLEAMQRAYQREPVRYLRPLREAALLTGMVGTRGEGGRLLVLTRDPSGRPALQHRREGGPRGRPRGGREVVGHLEMRFGLREGVVRGRVNEYAGERAALVASLAGVMAHLGLESLHLVIPAWDADFIAGLAPLGLTPTPTGTGHTYRIINLPVLAEALGDYLRERLGETAERLRFEQQGDRYRVRCGRAAVTLDSPRATQMVLGAPQGPAVPKAARPLRRLLEAVFPLPMILPGLNYV